MTDKFEPKVVGGSEAAPEQAPDPFDFKQIRLGGRDGEGVVIKKPLVTVPVRVPSKKTWFRCHPDPAHKIEVGIVELEDTSEDYLLSGADVYAAMEGLYTPVMLRTAMTSRRVLFLMKSKLPRTDGLGASWALSAAAAGDQAAQCWVRMQSNKDLGAYEVYEATGKIEDPVWPEENLRQLMKIAFHNRIITDLDHPVTKELLRGVPHFGWRCIISLTGPMIMI
jgi:hypothetical protein